MTIASDLFRTVTVKINDISQQLPYIVVNQADDNGDHPFPATGSRAEGHWVHRGALVLSPAIWRRVWRLRDLCRI